MVDHYWDERLKVKVNCNSANIPLVNDPETLFQVEGSDTCNNINEIEYRIFKSDGTERMRLVDHECLEGHYLHIIFDHRFYSINEEVPSNCEYLK